MLKAKSQEDVLTLEEVGLNHIAHLLKKVTDESSVLEQTWQIFDELKRINYVQGKISWMEDQDPKPKQASYLQANLERLQDEFREKYNHETTIAT